MIKTWNHEMSVEDTKDLAYWERNVLALHYADGWYNDDIPLNREHFEEPQSAPRYPGWRRVLTLEGGAITFHIPNDFDVGNLPEVAPNWDGHTTEEKWRRILEKRGVHG